MPVDSVELPAISIHYPVERRGGCTTHDRELTAFLLAAEQNRGKFLGLARRLTRCREDAEDIVQHALLKAFTNLGSFRGEAQMSTWLRTIVLNTAREHMRGLKGRVFVSLEYTADAEGNVLMRDFADPGRDPEEQLAGNELIEVLVGEVNRLSLASRRAIQLCMLDELPQAQAADALNSTKSAIKASVCRGKRILARRLWNRLGMAADHTPPGCV